MQEFFRISVPDPDAEVVCGIGLNNFSGIMARVAYGGVFIGAGGYPLGIPTADASYAGMKRAHTTLNIAIGGIVLGALLGRQFCLTKDMCGLSVAINAVAFGAGTLTNSIFAGIMGGTTSSEGTVSVYADRTIGFVSPIAINATAGVTASLTGGVVASVNSIVAASLNGITVGSFGVYSATMSAGESHVVGDRHANISARSGTCYVEGTTVQIGRNTGPTELPGNAYSGFMTGGQKATTRVDIRSDDIVTLEAGLPTLTGEGVTKLVANEDHLRAQSGQSSMTLDGRFMARAGNSGIHMGLKKLKMFVSKTRLESTYETAANKAETVFRKAEFMASQAEDAINNKKWWALAGAVLGTGAALPAAILTASESNVGKRVGIATGEVVAGTALGALTTMGILMLVEQKLSQAAREAAKAGAETAYKLALTGATAALQAEYTAQSASPLNPRIEVTDTEIKMSVGLSAITISSNGIDIKSPLKSVTINGQPITGMMPSTIEVD